MSNRYVVMGQFAVVDSDGCVRELSGRGAVVLAILLVASPESVSRGRLIHGLWGNRPPSDPDAALDSIASRLRLIIGDDLVTTAGGYRVSDAAIDTGDYEQAATKALQTCRGADFEAAQMLWTGSPYVGFEDVPSVRDEANRLSQLWARVDLGRLRDLVSSGRESDALFDLHRMVEEAPYDEDALGLYMRALYGLGRKRDALSVFRDYETELAEETGLQPSPTIRELELAILVDEFEPQRPEPREAVPINMTTSYVDRAPGERVAVGRFGHGPPILIHPGWLSSLGMVSSGVDMRSPFWSALSNTNELVIFDRFGTGMSDGSPDELSFDASVAELKAVLRRTMDGPVPVWAASGAGPIAIQAAIEAPELISHLLLYATYASGPATFPPRIAHSVVAMVEASWGMGSYVLANLLFPAASAENLDAWTNGQRVLTTPEVATGLLRQMYDADVGALLSDLSIPCLVIHYKGDKAIPITGGENLARSIPNAELVALDGITHYPLAGEEQLVVGLIDQFLTSTVS